MAQPAPTPRNIDWKVPVVLLIALLLFAAAYLFKGPTVNVHEVPYPQFLEMLKNDQIDKRFGLELISSPGSPDTIRGRLSGQLGEVFKAQVPLKDDPNLKSTLETQFGVVVTPKVETPIWESKK